MADLRRTGRPSRSRKSGSDKERRRLIVSSIVLDTLQDLKMAYPKTTESIGWELQAIAKELDEITTK